MNYILRFKLTSLLNSRVLEIENDDGVMEKGVFIPLDINGLSCTKNNEVSVFGFVNSMIDKTGHGWSHYIKMKTSKAVVDKMNALGYFVPFIGNMKHSPYKMKFQDSINDDKVPVVE